MVTYLIDVADEVSVAPVPSVLACDAQQAVILAERTCKKSGETKKRCTVEPGV